MIDLAALLASDIPESVPALAAEDAQLDEIITLADHNQLTEAAALAQSVWHAGTRDVRTLGFLLGGAYAQDGLRALPPILRALSHLLGPPWAALSPLQNKERYADGALRWLFSTIMAQLRFHQHAGKEPWQTTLQDWAKLPQSELLTLLETTGNRIADVTGHSGAKNAALSLLTFLKRLPPSAALAASPASPDLGTAAAATTPEGSEGAASAASGSTLEDPSLPAVSSANGGAKLATLSVPLSPPMHKLLRKLDAFGRLVNLGKFRHAAIVYKDIQASLTGFDPRQYFPSLFGDYYGQLVTHADKITKHIGEDKGFLADALKELYQTDLEIFISSKG